MPELTRVQKRLCTILQNGLPICRRPYAEIAKSLCTDEKTVLQLVNDLERRLIVRRTGAVINYRALGKTGTLVTAHIDSAGLPKIVEAVNSLEGVSHNYLRDHYYNLWFTLQAASQKDIKVSLANLSNSLKVRFHTLPAKRIFKLDVRFNIEGNGSTLLTINEELVGGAKTIAADKVVELTDDEKYVISRLQTDLDCVAQPFDFVCRKGLAMEDILKILKKLIAKGVIRRIAVIVDHRRLGFSANALFAAKVAGKKIEQTGKKLARLSLTSHCYERETFKGWPYNLLAMIHSRSMVRLQRAVTAFTKSENIISFELLPTVTELKKQPVNHSFD